MSDVLDRVRQRYPDYKDVPDNDLALAIGSKYPQYLESDSAFKSEYQQAATTVANKGLQATLETDKTLVRAISNPAVLEANQMAQDQSRGLERASQSDVAHVEDVAQRLQAQQDQPPKTDLTALDNPLAAEFTPGIEPGTTKALDEPLVKIGSPFSDEQRRSMALKHPNVLGAVDSIIENANSLQTPKSLALLGAGLAVGGMGPVATRAMSLGFAALMAKSVPDIAAQLGEEYAKPEAERDQVKIAKLISDGAIATGFTTLAAFHGAEPHGRTVARMISNEIGAKPYGQANGISGLDFEAIRGVAPLTAQALEELPATKPTAVDFGKAITSDKLAVPGDEPVAAPGPAEAVVGANPAVEAQGGEMPSQTNLGERAGEAVRIERPKEVAAPPTDVPPGQSGQPEAAEPTVNPVQQKGKRVGSGLTGLNRFNKETDINGPDIMSWIHENMKMLSKSAAKEKWGKEKFALNSSEYDDAQRLSQTHHNVIYDSNWSSPNQVAQAAYDAKVLKSPDVAELWKAINASSEKRSNAFKTAAKEKALNEALAGEHESWLKATAEGQQKVSADDLKVGDFMEVDGEHVEVTHIDPDSGDVTLKDGKKFGKQTLESGKSIHVEKLEQAETSTEFAPVEPAKVETPKLRAGEKGTGDLLQGADAPFNLAGEKATDFERIQQEKAKSEKSAAEAKAIQDKQQGGFTGMGGAVPDELTGGAGKDIYGIAERVREQRARAGQADMPLPGEGVSAQDSVAHGREILSKDAGAADKAMKAFEADPKKAVSADAVAAARAQGELLARIARRTEEKFGTDSPEYRAAWKALSDWDARSKAMQTEWHKIGMAQQGETDIDTGTFTGLQRAYKESTGKDFDPVQAKKAEVLAERVRVAEASAEEARQKLYEQLKQQETVEPHVRLVADKLKEYFGKRAASALDRIRARRAEGRSYIGGIDPEAMVDYADYGASKILSKGIEGAEMSADWAKEMAEELGDYIKPHLKDIWDAARKTLDKGIKKIANIAPERRRKVFKTIATDAERDALDAASKTVREASARVADAESKARVAKSAAEKKALEEAAKVAQAAADKANAKIRNAAIEAAKAETKERIAKADLTNYVWRKIKEYLEAGNENRVEIIHKVATDLGRSVDEVLKALAKNRPAKRISDDLWQKQRQAKLIRTIAKQWVANAQETALSKALPMAARILFSLKTGLHGTVAIGTHAALEAFAHPIITAENFGKMYKLVLSPEYHEMQVHELAQRPFYNTAQRAGLVNDMTKMEDFNDPKLAQGFPLLAQWFKEKLSKVKLGFAVGMGNRGYGVLKIMRQDLFDHEWSKLANSERSPEMAKAIADSVNHMTGVVKTGSHPAANWLLFAPKLLLSRLSVMVGDPARALNSLTKMGNMTAEEKWFATNQLKEKAKIFGTWFSLLVANQALNTYLGDKQKINGVPESLGGAGFNPMASDFMKFRVAGMRVAWGSPFLTMMRLPLRIIQIGKGDGGKAKYLIYPDESMYKTIGSYLRTQESPILSPIASLVTKADYAGRPLPQIPGYGPPPPVPKRLAKEGVKPYTWPEFITETALPIPFEEGAREVFKHGLGTTPDEQAAMLKAIAIILSMAATGARVTEDTKQ